MSKYFVENPPIPIGNSDLALRRAEIDPPR
jgi:hypothetical protein